ncbi:MAG TPA: helix-turn-helix domain-containing protein [bacterium]|jgi:excisionase family DNA binding protein|nr:helix-turn-helix domain-containing protein [bacterium]
MQRLTQEPEGIERELLTVEQAAEYLQVHKVTVYKYIRLGWLPAAKLGKVYRIFRRDVEALLSRLTPQSP